MKTMDGVRLAFADILVPHQGAPVQVVGGLSVAQATRLARAGLRALVISGNLGQPDARARYDAPPAQIGRHVAGFIAAVSRV
jgi:hypothetical protein